MKKTIIVLITGMILMTGCGGTQPSSTHSLSIGEARNEIKVILAENANIGEFKDKPYMNPFHKDAKNPKWVAINSYIFSGTYKSKISDKEEYGTIIYEIPEFCETKKEALTKAVVKGNAYSRGYSDYSMRFQRQDKDDIEELNALPEGGMFYDYLFLRYAKSKGVLKFGKCLGSRIVPIEEYKGLTYQETMNRIISEQHYSHLASEYDKQVTEQLKLDFDFRIKEEELDKQRQIEALETDKRIQEVEKNQLKAKREAKLKEEKEIEDALQKQMQMLQ